MECLTAGKKNCKDLKIKKTRHNCMVMRHIATLTSRTYLRFYSATAAKLHSADPEIQLPGLKRIGTKLNALQTQTNVVPRQKFIFLIDDHFILQPPPLVKTINEIVEALAIQAGMHEKLPLAAVTESWNRYEGDRTKNLHQRVADTYEVFFRSRPAIAKFVFRNPDVNLLDILNQFYKNNCEVHNLQFLKKIVEIKHAQLGILKSNIWDQIKVNYRDLLLWPLNGVIGLQNFKTLSWRHKASFDRSIMSFFKVERVKDYKLLLISKDEAKAAEMRSVANRMNLSIMTILLHDDSSKINTSLAKTLDEFKFFEKMSNFIRANHVLETFLSRDVISCNIQQLNDIIYLFERSTNA